jgi:hypothetical protein
MTQPESGWENPDQHPDLTQRPRPMFDARGKAVTQAPPPDPAPELEHMGLFGEPRTGKGERPSIAPGTVVSVDLMTPLDRPLDGRLAEIHALALAALEDASPANWAVALDRIVKLTK